MMNLKQNEKEKIPDIIARKKSKTRSTFCREGSTKYVFTWEYIYIELMKL